jgi:hypothetical protein
MAYLGLKIAMHETVHVHGLQAFRELKANCLNICLTFGMSSQVTQISHGKVFHCSENELGVLIPPEKVHKKAMRGILQ